MTEEFSEFTAYESDNEPVLTDDKRGFKDDDTYVALHAAGFKEFLLKPELLRAIQDCGFEHPSEVQNQCIPKAILGNDVICQAKSGMGKTAVFVLSTLQQLQVDTTSNNVQALILCHTRELAYQICHEFDRFKKYMNDIKTAVFFGGLPIQQNRDTLKEEKPHIVIGTPGRVKALVEEGALSLKNCKYFILDECDKMIDTMRADIQYIFKSTPFDKQVMMFSATLNEDVRAICKKFMHNPLEIYINDGSKLTLHGLKQYYLQLEEKQKNRRLVELLDVLEFNQVVIFVKSPPRARELDRLLQECNFPSICIYGGAENRGGLSQEERITRFNKFKNYDSRIMVATNLFGRGIDIERVNVVINYDMPESADSYLHRVGRAGRFGTKGLAISFVTSEEDAKVLNDVQAKFVVSIPALPENIDTSTYTA